MIGYTLETLVILSIPYDEEQDYDEDFDEEQDYIYSSVCSVPLYIFDHVTCPEY